MDDAIREVSSMAQNSEGCASASLTAEIVRGLASQVDLLGSGVSLLTELDADAATSLPLATES